MEVRVNTHGSGKLATKTFFSDDSGFGVASVIVYGNNDAAVLDTQFNLSNAHRLIAEILETGKNLKYIYITHAHPDHYFGLAYVAEAFPEAKVVAVPATAGVINKQFFGKIEYWEKVIGPMNTCRKTVPIEPLEDNYFMLEGNRIEIIPELVGDMKNNTVVWIPSIRTLYGSDVLFNQAHPFTCELSFEERRQWVEDLKRLEALDARVVIPGHERVGMPFDYSSCDFIRNYITVTEEAIAETKDEAGFYYFMVKQFPYATLLLSNTMNAGFFKGGMDWSWKEED